MSYRVVCVCSLIIHETVSRNLNAHKNYPLYGIHVHEGRGGVHDFTEHYSTLKGNSCVSCCMVGLGRLASSRFTSVE